MNKKAIALAAILSLSGCGNDVGSMVAQCELEAMKINPNKHLESSNEIGNYIQLCMRAKGYDFRMAHNLCQPALDAERNSYCYRPISTVEGKIWDLKAAYSNRNTKP